MLWTKKALWKDILYVIVWTISYVEGALCQASLCVATLKAITAEVQYHVFIQRPWRTYLGSFLVKHKCVRCVILTWKGVSAFQHDRPSGWLLTCLFLSVDLLDDTVTQSPQQLEDVLDFIKSTISSLRRSAEQDTEFALREKRPRRRAQSRGRRVQSGGTWASGQGGGGGKRRRKGNSGQGHGCKLRQIQLNVSDLGLGYQTKEEMIFRYCSGPCTNSETNYDKILNNLTQNRKLLRDSPPHACCRPIAYDDDLSFLDDNLIYHTMKKHSARKCGCVWQ